MQKVYFCPEENTKPSNCNCATFYTKIFINFLFVQSLIKQLGLNKGILMQWQKDLVKKI